MTKKELAECADVSSRTLTRWMLPLRDELKKMGVTPRTRKLKPCAVRLICDFCGIDL